jgi:hypothetical protein
MGPMQFESNVRIHHRFRYVAQGALATVGITDTNCVSSQGAICTVAALTVTPWVLSTRIKRVDMWAAPAAQGQSATCSIEWFGFNNSPNIQESDTTLSVGKNAYLSSSPPDTSLASFWQKATGTQLFSLTCPSGTIIDIIYDSIIGDDETSDDINVAGAVVLGEIYYLALDHNNGDMLKPVSLTTTL